MPESKKPARSAEPPKSMKLFDWVGFPDWHQERKVFFQMKKNKTDAGVLSLQRYPAYIVGKNAAQVDIVAEHPSISRRHAVLLHHKVSGCVYVMDLKSTQGTFVNGKKIAPHMPTRITKETSVVFGCSARTYLLTGCVPPGKDALEETATAAELVKAAVSYRHTVTSKDKQYSSGPPVSKKRKAPEPAAKPNPIAAAIIKPKIDMEKYKAMTPKARLAFMRKQQAEKQRTARAGMRAIQSQGFVTGPVKTTPITAEMRAAASKAEEAAKAAESIGPAMPPRAFLSSTKGEGDADDETYAVQTGGEAPAEAEAEEQIASDTAMNEDADAA